MNPVAAGDALTTELLETSAEHVGGVVANLVNFANPAEVVIGGGVLRTGPRVAEIIADVVASRSTEIAAAGLTVREATLEHQEGVTGAALLAIENLLTPASLSLWVEEGRPHAHSVQIQRSGMAFS